ncbi:MAG TPA: SAM-dependent chlorinase/fluorinase [Pyrinomonadaceae bacterium]|nr:SAM-dependent chlorinase/fluorinase [Pyrinomonadaceae bacterium]
MKSKLRDKKARGRDLKSSPRIFSAGSLASAPIITLLTDFGTSDYFVAALKGRILSINPRAGIVDIAHDILPQDIEAAAFTLLSACETFPPGTIHVVVVDPGVGSSRRPLAVEASKMFFVGPDNGVFSYVYERLGRRRIIHLTDDSMFFQPVSSTFHGRDVFAPVAAAISLGVKPDQMGELITDAIRLPSLRPEMLRDESVRARVIHIDRFGNCVTNITDRELTFEMIAAGATLQINGKKITSFRRYFAEGAGREKLFAVWGSAGFLEIAAQNDSAAGILKAKRGDAITAILAAD